MTETPLPDYRDPCWPIDTEGVAGWDDAAPTDQALAAALAGATMRSLSGGRVGGCPVTVRPASRACAERTWRAYPVGSRPASAYSVRFGGGWLNVRCGHGSACGCDSAAQIRLGVASQVSDVTIDGATLDPSAYRLDRGGWLVRTDGEAWPLCQDLAAVTGEPGTWTVTFVPGVPVDRVGARAAGLLAGEFLSALQGGQCALPAQATQVVRDGVTVDLGPATWPRGRTGLPVVDAYLDTINPNALRRGSVGVWSPDVARHRGIR